MSNVKHPDHYNWIEGIECQDVVKHFSWAAGNAIKYIWRHLHKGKPVEDLQKAVDSLQTEIDRLKGGHCCSGGDGGLCDCDDEWLDSKDFSPPGGGRWLLGDWSGVHDSAFYNQERAVRLSGDMYVDLGGNATHFEPKRWKLVKQPLTDSGSDDTKNDR